LSIKTEDFWRRITAPDAGQPLREPSDLNTIVASSGGPRVNEAASTELPG
jgi:hypothetical protein